MIRRLGYILGLLFVTACLAAIPATWARRTVLIYSAGAWRASASAGAGRLWLGVSRPVARLNPGFTVHRFPGTTANYHRLVAFGVRRYAIGTGWSVYCPLWMPALAASPFMAWRWRWGRRQQMAGFQVVEATEAT